MLRAGQALVLELVPSKGRASEAVFPKVPEREGKRPGVPEQEGPRMEAEPVLPRRGRKTWVGRLAMHHLKSEPPL